MFEVDADFVTLFDLGGRYFQGYDAEIQKQHDANKTHTKCVQMRSEGGIPDSFKGACDTAAYNVRVSPGWRAFYAFLPEIPSHRSAGAMVVAVFRELAATCQALFENNKLLVFLLALCVFLAFGGVIVDRFKRCIRETANEQRLRDDYGPVRGFKLVAPPLVKKKEAGVVKDKAA